MPDYFYVTIICVLFIYMMIHAIYFFNKGKYYPYLDRNKEDSFKKKIFDIGWVIVLSVSFHNLSTDTKQPILFLLFLITLPLCISILNYLSYAKIKDRKIIYQTVILDISLIALFLIVVIIRRIYS